MEVFFTFPQRDKKEANYLVTKANRDHCLFKAFQSGELKIIGASPHVVPEALKKLREETGTVASAPTSLDAACMVDEKLGQATLPDSARLHFHVSDELKKRMLAFEKEFGPPAKRRQAEPSSLDLRFPGKLKRIELASKDFEFAQAGKIRIATKSTTRQFLENDKLETMRVYHVSGDAAHYLHNTDSHRHTLQKGTVLAKATQADFIDAADDDKKQAREGSMMIPFEMSTESLFTYDFDGQGENVKEFQTMIDDTHRALSATQVGLYNHTLSDHLQRGKEHIRCVTPHAKKDPKVEMVIKERPVSSWTAAQLGDFLTAFDFQGPAVCGLAWHVTVGRGVVVPNQKDPSQLAILENVVLEPGDCIKLTVRSAVPK